VHGSMRSYLGSLNTSRSSSLCGEEPDLAALGSGGVDANALDAAIAAAQASMCGI